MLTLLQAQLNNIWEFPVDNRFSTKVTQTIGTAVLLPQATGSTKRTCTKCQGLEFWSPHFSIRDTWEELENSLRTCGFCKLRYDLCQHLDRAEFPSVRFDREQSVLKLNEGYPPVLSIRRGPEAAQTSRASHIQIGFPQLPPLASPMYYDLLRMWLKDCDDEHPECRAPRGGPLPTRLIHLGVQGPTAIRLYETRPTDTLEYIALSHPWGKGPHFRTTLDNIKAHQECIEFEKLPATFQHAVVTCRELGLEYLWIDSICIIQGEGGDFGQEAKRMEDVFSSAFCVIAASSARGQNDGFLNPRIQEQPCFTFDHAAGLPPLYVSPFMDNFNDDVLEASLSKRGWVLQERALARRSIYFTNRQTYWECGRGIRCETLTKMDNKLASFLGDPNFPSKLSNDATSRGEKIRLYEDLYRQYTRLDFTHISDRPIAIAGLEKRLIRDLKAHGGFGVFDDGRSLFQRSLLWQRGREVSSLAKILPSGPSTMSVPTWSWMAYDGGIDFLNLPLGRVHWFPEAIKSPWASGGVDTWHTGDGKEFVELKAWARSFAMGALSPRRTAEIAHDEVVIVYDSPDVMEVESGDVMCVVVGKEKNNGLTEGETVHFLLFIVLSNGLSNAKGGVKVCERVGVGHMEGRFLDLESQAQSVVIR